MGVHAYATRHEGVWGPTGKKVRVNWARVNKGIDEHPEMRCQRAAQQLGCGDRVDELCAGMPSLTTVTLLHIGLPHQGPKYGNPDLTGKLKNRMCGLRDGPHIWEDTVKKQRSRGA